MVMVVYEIDGSDEMGVVPNVSRFADNAREFCASLSEARHVFGPSGPAEFTAEPRAVIDWDAHDDPDSGGRCRRPSRLAR